MSTSAIPCESFTTCDLVDELADEARVIGSELRNFGGRNKFAGIAVTIKCFEDNSLVKQALQSPGTGQVLVIDGGNSRRCALLGDMLAAEAAANGWEGIVVDGCVRDSEVLRRLDIGIKARGTVPRRSNKNGEGQSGLAISIAGVVVRPDDRIYADCDGLVIVGSERC